MALGCSLHLVEPLGFDVSEKACRRAGLDYWPRLEVHRHPSYAAYRAAAKSARAWCFSTRAERTLFEADFRPGDHLIFGKETGGLDLSILEAHKERVLSLPMVAGERSLNLATAVCAAAYEGLRQLLVRGDVTLDPTGRVGRPPGPARSHPSS